MIEHPNHVTVHPGYVALVALLGCIACSGSPSPLAVDAGQGERLPADGAPADSSLATTADSIAPDTAATSIASAVGHGRFVVAQLGKTLQSLAYQEHAAPAPQVLTPAGGVPVPVALANRRHDSVLYAVHVAGKTEVHLASLSGSTVTGRQLVSLDLQQPLELFWSADEQVFAISFGSPSLKGMLLQVFDMQGQLLATRDQCPRLWGFVGQSRYFALSYYGLQGVVQLVDLEHDVDRVVNADYEPAFDKVAISPDGAKLLAVGYPHHGKYGVDNGEVFVIDPQTQAMHQLTQLGADYRLQAYFARFGYADEIWIVAESLSPSLWGSSRHLYRYRGGELALHWQASAGEGIWDLLPTERAGLVWAQTRIPNQDKTRYLDRLHLIDAHGTGKLLLEPADYGAEQQGNWLKHIGLACDGLSLYGRAWPHAGLPLDPSRTDNGWFVLTPSGQRQSFPLQQFDPLLSRMWLVCPEAGAAS